MQAQEHRDVVATVGDVEARVLYGQDGVSDAVELLDRAEEAAGVPLVDESERARLDALAAGHSDRGPHWHSVLARRGSTAAGYAALVLPPHEDPGADTNAHVAHGDVAVDHSTGFDGPALHALLTACDALGHRHSTRRLQVWMRHVTEHDLRHAAAAGYCVDRRLGVLSRPLDGLDTVPPPEGVTIRSFTDADADAVVDVLARAYAGSADAGWTREQFDEKRAYAWFDPADLLIAEGSDGRPLGLHWTKRRDEHTGEVYNLAVHPEAQGMSLGAALLSAGLTHLRDAGCDRVMLWVDLANERAVRLYTSQGFTVAWEDVALGRELLPEDQSSVASRLRSDSGTSL